MMEAEARNRILELEEGIAAVCKQDKPAADEEKLGSQTPESHSTQIISGSKYGTLIRALAFFFLVVVGFQVWALIGMWYVMGM